MIKRTEWTALAWDTLKLDVEENTLVVRASGADNVAGDAVGVTLWDASNVGWSAWGVGDGSGVAEVLSKNVSVCQDKM